MNLTKILESGSTIADATKEIVNPVGTDILTGKLEFIDYPNLEEIELQNNEERVRVK